MIMQCKEQKTNCENCILHDKDLLCMVANTINDSDIQDLLKELKKEINQVENNRR